jgi:hypothetical protein
VSKAKPIKKKEKETALQNNSSPESKLTYQHGYKKLYQKKRKK